MNNQQLLLAREERKKQKELLKDTRSQNLEHNKLTDAINQIHTLKNELNKQREVVIPNEAERNEILLDLIKHDQNNSEKDNYNMETMDLALQMYSLCPKAYALLAKKLPFPAPRKIESISNQSISDIPEKLLNIEEVNNTVNIWKDKYHIPKTINISACLSVDAIYFKPDGKIKSDNSFEGFAFPDELLEKLPKNAFNYFLKNPESLNFFINANWNKIIKAAFVFRVQPYNVDFKPFVIYIKPASNGKSNNEIIKLLHTIRWELKKRRIIIKSYAFDGDNAYRDLHFMYFESYISKVLITNKIKIKSSKKLRIVSDFYHIIKRLRYRLLSSIIHIGFDIENPFIDIVKLREILNNMGEVVWNNELYTKMHDSLPLELFKAENLIRLIQNKYFEASAYWFPIVFANIGMNTKNLGFNLRCFILKCAFFFLVYYWDCWGKNDGKLRQKKYNDCLDVTFYSKSLLIEFANLLHSNIQLMNNEINFGVSRNGTEPLEHKFGISRIKSKNVNTLTRFIHVISSMQSFDSELTYKQLRNFNEDVEKIKGRTASPNVIVNKCDIDKMNIDLPFSPENVAKAFLSFSGFNVENNQKIDFDQIISWTEFFLSYFTNDDDSKKRKVLTLNTFNYGVDHCCRARRLIMGVPVKSPARNLEGNIKSKKELFTKMCYDIFGKKTTKRDLADLLKYIQQIHGKCPNAPDERWLKNDIFEYIALNVVDYYYTIKRYKPHKY